MDPERMPPPNPATLPQGMAHITIDQNGAAAGCVWASANNQPQGHLEVHAPSVEAVKLLANCLAMWINQNSRSIVLPPNGAKLK